MKYRISLAEDNLPYLRIIWMLLIIAVLFLLSLAAMKQRNGFYELQFNTTKEILHPATTETNHLISTTTYYPKQ